MRNMRLSLIGSVVFVAILTSALLGQSATYAPLGAWVDPNIEAVTRWETERQVYIQRIQQAVNSDARPLLPGLRPRSLEMLQDAILRKHPRMLRGSYKAARQMIIRRYANNMPQLRGIMAEAIFIDRNPDWKYVSKPNAPQHDVYRRVPGRQTPFNGQIKFHISGQPSIYAKDMRIDSRAHRFFVPDDHVDSLKNYLRAKAEQLTTAGDAKAAKTYWRDYGRVRPLGASSHEVDTLTKQAAKIATREQYSVYLSFGASMVLAFGPTVWDWGNGNVASNQALYRATQTLSLLGAGIGTDALLMTVKQGAMRGTLRGNAIVGTAIAITQVTWLLYEHGWSKAFTDAQFFEAIGGSIGGIAFGIVASGAAIAWIPGPGWVVGGGAILAGAAAGTVGYIGGRGATQMVLEIVAPDKLRDRQRQRLMDVRKTIDDHIAESRQWPLARS